MHLCTVHMYTQTIKKYFHSYMQLHLCTVDVHGNNFEKYPKYSSLLLTMIVREAMVSDTSICLSVFVNAILSFWDAYLLT